jgi:hypothetical protein
MNRQTLRSVLNSINFCRKAAADMIHEPDNKEWIAAMINGLIDAENAGLNLWEATRIKDGDEKEPLNSEEEDIFNRLQGILKLGAEDFAKMSNSQKFSCARVLVKQGLASFRPPVSGAITDYIGLHFTHIMIGVEKDGYAHS